MPTSRWWTCGDPSRRFPARPRPGVAMPIWVHRLLGTVIQVAGFFGGAIAGGCIGALILMALASAAGPPKERPPDPQGWGAPLTSCCGLSVGAPLFFGGAWL